MKKTLLNGKSQKYSLNVYEDSAMFFDLQVIYMLIDGFNSIIKS